MKFVSLVQNSPWIVDLPPQSSTPHSMSKATGAIQNINVETSDMIMSHFKLIIRHNDTFGGLYVISVSIVNLLQMSPPPQSVP